MTSFCNLCEQPWTTDQISLRQRQRTGIVPGSRAGRPQIQRASAARRSFVLSDVRKHSSLRSTQVSDAVRGAEAVEEDRNSFLQGLRGFTRGHYRYLVPYAPHTKSGALRNRRIEKLGRANPLPTHSASAPQTPKSRSPQSFRFRVAPARLPVYLL